MDWDAIGAIGEIVGAAAVIATLIYLATQVRQSSRNMHNATSWAITQALADLNARISSDGEFAELWLRGCRNVEILESVEVERFRTFVMDLLNLAIYVHKHPTDEHQFYIDYLASMVRGNAGFKKSVQSARRSMPSDLYEKLTNDA